MICKFKDSVFPNGFPEVAFDVAGRKVYDPRDSGQSVADPSTWQFTTNAALIWADYICNYRFGCQISYLDKINEDDLIAAADICDELVVTQSGTERGTRSTAHSIPRRIRSRFSRKCLMRCAAFKHSSKAAIRSSRALGALP